MTNPNVEARSRKIVDSVISNVDWPSIKRVHIYKSVPDWHEADTGILVKEISKQWPQVNITQPSLSKDEPLPNTKFDLIIVPVLGFDKDNNRLGLGGGYYDKLLADQPQAKKIGLCFEAGYYEKHLPTEPHDIALDTIVTEKRVL